MMNSGWKRLCALTLVMLITGCWPLPSGESQPTGSTPAAQSTAHPGEELAAGDPDALDIAGRAEDPPTLDPALAGDSYSQFIVRQLFSGLVAFDNNLRVVPDIAASMPAISQDGTLYTFVLRRGVLFAGGEEVTSADFKYSFERATDPKLAGTQPPTSLPAGLYLSDIVGVREKLEGKAVEISGVRAPDPYTLEIKIDAPKAYFLSKLTAGPASVVQRANVESGPYWTAKANGTGPFKLETWVNNQHISLVPNPNFYAGAPQLRRVNIWMGANASEELGQYETGGLDVANVPLYDIERVTDRNNPLSRDLLTVPDLSVTYLGLNMRQKPFDDPRVREAISLVIDKQKIARVMLHERVAQAGGFVPPAISGYPAQTLASNYNVTRARQLLAESTYKGGANLPRLRLYTSGDQLGPMLRDVISQTLGIEIDVYEVEWADYLTGLDRGDYPMFTLSWGADYPDPEAVLGSLFRSNSPANQTGYRNADVDAALSAASEESDASKRMAIYSQIERRVLMDYPAVPLYHSVQYILVKPNVRNLHITPLGILSLKDVRLAGR